MKDTEISVPLSVGDKIVIMDNVSSDDDEFSGMITYQGIVEQFVPETNLIRMNDGVQRTELLEYINEAGAYQIIRE